MVAVGPETSPSDALLLRQICLDIVGSRKGRIHG